MTHSENSPKAQEVKLRECPFCGGSAYLSDRCGDGYTEWVVTCEKCLLELVQDRDHRAIRSWNTRAPNENQPPLAEKAENIMNVEVKCLNFVDCPYCGDRQEWDYISIQTCGECCSIYQVVKATNERAKPHAEKSPTTPQLSGQSEGNREKEALEWLANTEYDLVKQLRSDDWGVVTMEGYVVRGVGKSPLLAIQNAMNSQGGAS